MSRAFVVMTAMPPTTGHMDLIRFADLLADQPHFPQSRVTLLVCTQPHEPMTEGRVGALRLAIARNNLSVEVKHFSKAIEQDPATPGFWDMWRDIMRDNGFQPGDYIVASEQYGKRLAAECGGVFMPFDMDRSMNPAKATNVRYDVVANWADIIPEFQPYLRTRVTVFGAESTGKTTLAKKLADELDSQWVFEYARPYLEHTTNEITVRSMTAIWRGQAALQDSAWESATTPYLIQDTDLFTTAGYWQFPHWRDTLGYPPAELRDYADYLKSDLYLITKSNIPFEPDPLRYGGDHREGSDEYWIDVCEQYHLNYVILDSPDPLTRLHHAIQAIDKVGAAKRGQLYYNRHGL